MTDKTYNGWTNYETWLVALWIDNEEGSYSDRCAAADEAWEDTDEADTPEDRSDAARIALAKWIDDYIEEVVDSFSLAGFVADLVSSATSQVDSFEIADNWLSEQEGYEGRS